MAIKAFVGIDLGLNYCSVSVFDRQRMEPLLLKENDLTSSFPTWIMIEKNRTGGYTHLFGQTAKNIGSLYSLFESKQLMVK